jgi:DNA (cytosine-5)-methyltransferase 1
MTVEELVRSCYSHVSLKDIDKHLKRVKSLPQPKDVLSTPKVLKSGKRGICFADIFCGAGGLSLGFELEGGICKFAIDQDSIALETFKINRSENIEVINSEIASFIKNSRLTTKVPLVIGGPPCQGFSVANQQPKRNDKRNHLYAEFIEIASRFEAKIVVIENVPGILKYWDLINIDLKKRGFEAQIFLLEAFEFGVPQKRKRVFITAIRGVSPAKKEAFLKLVTEKIDNTRVEAKKYNIEDAIYGLPPLTASRIRNSTYLENKNVGYSIEKGTKLSNNYLSAINKGFADGFLFNHRSKYNNERDIRIYESLQPGMISKSGEFNKLNPYKNRDHIFKDKFFRLAPGKPSKTITAHMYFDCHMYVHPQQNRGLTPREAARIQGFPDQYIFLGKPNEWYRQIGNSVSPLVARSLASAILTSAEQVL